MPVLKNPRWERFAQELAGGKPASEAYVIAGFKPSRSNAAGLAHAQNILDRVSEILDTRDKAQGRALERAIEKTAISKEWVIERLVENVERAMQTKAVTVGGEATGEYKYEGTVANRALELLGRELGMFIERKEVGGPGDFARMSEEELYDFINRTASEAGLSASGSSTSSGAQKAGGSGRAH